jgi:hypothetical protein
MNAMNTLTRNEGPTLQEVQTSELKAIVGGYLAGHKVVQLYPQPSPWFAPQLTEPVGGFPQPNPELGGGAAAKRD